MLQVQVGDDLGDSPEAGVNNFSVAACTTLRARNSHRRLQRRRVGHHQDVAVRERDTEHAEPHSSTWLGSRAGRADSSSRLNFFDVGDISNAAGQPIAGALTVTAVDATARRGRESCRRILELHVLPSGITRQ